MGGGSGKHLAAQQPRAALNLAICSTADGQQGSTCMHVKCALAHGLQVAT